MEQAKVDRPLSRIFAAPAIAFGTSAIVLFYNAFRFALPLGYAGLYAQASGQIAQAGFRLPQAIHFYGPGDVPFAYPPLAFYAMALFLDLGISPLTYLRFVPPLLSLLALIPLYLLAERLAHSKFGAAVAVGICAASPALYTAHTWASGVVRALAFLFLLCGLYLFDRAIRQERWSLPALAGVFFGLVFLTHLYYAFFLVLCVVCWLIPNLRLQCIKAATRCVAIAVVMVAPWALLMLSRYGTGPFLNAWFTHGNTTFLGVLTQPAALATWFSGNLSVIIAIPFLILFVALGFVYLIAVRQFTLPLLFLVSLLMLSPEGDRFIILVAAILAGTSTRVASTWLPRLRWADPLSQALLGLVALYAIFLGFQSIQKTRPQLQDGALKLSDYVQSTTSVQSRFLILAAPAEAEWFPYLLQREPLASKWGAEWLGTYYSASGLVGALNDCRRGQDVECLQNLHLDLVSDDILITLKQDKPLTVDLQSHPGCPQVTVIGQYLVWKVGCLIGSSSAQVTQ
jgi:4-amino-4-deoxy-L-arabinose transferase-like glycosyltransferase